MSRSFRLLRDRWAAQEMILARWLKREGETFAPYDPLCQLLVLSS